MPIEKVTATIGLPFGLGSLGGEWKPDDAQRRAAWEMYVELVTRVAVVELPSREGLLEEALASLHSLFPITREILRRYGPSVAWSDEEGQVTFGHLAVAVLNLAVRPFLARWHPLLEDRMSSRPTGAARQEWEQTWPEASKLRGDLAELRTTLEAYAGLLGEVCEAKSLLRFA